MSGVHGSGVYRPRAGARIHAVRFEERMDEPPEWYRRAVMLGRIYGSGGGSPYMTIETIEGTERVWPGDWIVRTEEGAFLRMANAVFTGLFEPLPTPKGSPDA